jgi:hypothetical protein
MSGKVVRSREFTDPRAVRALENDVRLASEGALSALRDLLDGGDAIRLLAAIKFNKIGRDPLHPGRALNLIEQVNQTFTALVSVRAVDYLFAHHPHAAPFRVNLGTARGSDIESLDGSVAAEVFAATHPASNQKLKKDIAKVRAVPARYRYVFFYCPGDHAPSTHGGVSVVPLHLDEWTAPS